LAVIGSLITARSNSTPATVAALQIDWVPVRGRKHPIRQRELTESRSTEHFPTPGDRFGVFGTFLRRVDAQERLCLATVSTNMTLSELSEEWRLMPLITDYC
jgi:hypothetical protein